MERPFPAYEGTEPFVFVCYAHDDAELVYPEITRLRDAGFHIWYDEGISPGSEWSATLAEQIQQCAVFLFFVTPQSVEREHCRQEVNFALEQRCTLLAVHLEETNVPGALQLNLSHRQAILKYEHSLKTYEEKLDRALEAAAAGRAESSRRSSDEILQIGDWALHPGSYRLTREDESHLIDPKDLNVLLHLAEAAPDLVTTEALLDRNWPGVVVGDNALHQVIGRLRRALGDDAKHPAFIETLPRRGYRLIAPLVASQLDSRVPTQSVDTSDNRDAGRSWIKYSLRVFQNRSVVAGLIVLVLVFMGWVMFRNVFDSSSEEVDDQITLAVLPFDNLTGDPEQEHFSYGLSKEIWTMLAAIDGLRVISMTSSSLFEESDLGIKEIGAKLTAQYLVEGSVNRSGANTRVSVHLIDVNNGAEVWSETYDRTLDDMDTILHLYDEIVSSVSQELPVFLTDRMTTDERPSLRMHSLEAYNLLQRAWSKVESEALLQESLPAALTLIERALEIDPMSALLHFERAANLCLQAEFGVVVSQEYFLACRESAQRALDIDPSYGLPHVLLGFVHDRVDLDFRLAVEEYTQAEQLGASVEKRFPWQQDTWRNAGLYKEGLELATEMEAIAPVNVWSKIVTGRFLDQLDRPEEAGAKFESALSLRLGGGETTHDLRTVLRELILHYLDFEKDLTRAIEIVSAYEESGALPEWARPRIALMQGNPVPLEQLADTWVRDRSDHFVSSSFISRAYYLVRNYEQHIRWIGIQVEERANLGGIARFLRRNPDYFDTLREWALEDPNKMVERLELIDTHRDLIDGVTERMIL